MDDDASTDVSREFLKDLARGREPFCERPWRSLKVTMTGKTKICCDFFTRLPEFDWPTAQDFHSPDGMWNHPYMQHLRGTMGMPDEVPFCTLCLTKDKRSPAHKDERARAKRDSLEVYRSFEEAAAVVHLRGSLVDHESLEGVTVALENGRAIRPFQRPAADYRRLVRALGMLGRGRVLQIGAPAPALVAFVAEANQALTVLDEDPTRLSRVRAICAPFGLEPTVATFDPPALLPFDADAFDAALLDGSLLGRPEHHGLLEDIARVVRSAGTLRVQRAPSGFAGSDLRRTVQGHGLKLDVSSSVRHEEDTVSFTALIPRAPKVTGLPMPSLRPPNRDD